MIGDWGNIKIDEDKVWKDSVNELKANLILMNQAQLRQGYGSDGIKLPAYSLAYARKKGVSILPKTINDTGLFYKGFYVLITDKYIEIGSRDRKTFFLENNKKILGDSKIFGLVDENIKEFINLFIPIYTHNLTNAIIRA